MAVPPAAERTFADPQQFRRLHLAQLRPFRPAKHIRETHPSYPLVNACPIHAKPPSWRLTKPDTSRANGEPLGYLALRSRHRQRTTLSVSGSGPLISSSPVHPSAPRREPAVDPSYSATSGRRSPAASSDAPNRQRLAIHPGQFRRFSARPALQDQGDGQQAPNLSAIAALCCELTQCLSRMLRPCDRDCLAQLILLAANRRRENRTAISHNCESPVKVRISAAGITLSS